MNRRSFLGALLGAFGSALVPVPWWKRLPRPDAADLVLTAVSDEPFSHVAVYPDFGGDIDISWDPGAARIFRL